MSRKCFKMKEKKNKNKKKKNSTCKACGTCRNHCCCCCFFHELCKLLSPSSLCKVRNRDVGNENGTWKPKFMLYFKHEFKCFISISNNEKTIEIRGPPGPSVLLFSSCLSWQWNTQNECLEKLLKRMKWNQLFFLVFAHSGMHCLPTSAFLGVCRTEQQKYGTGWSCRTLWTNYSQRFLICNELK